MKFLLWKLINKVIKSSSFYVSLCFFLTISLTFFSEVPISCWVFKKSHFKWFFNNTIITINFFSTPIFHGFLEPTLIFVSEMHVQKTKCVSTKFGQTNGRFMAPWNTTKSLNNTILYSNLINKANSVILFFLHALKKPRR